MLGKHLVTLRRGKRVAGRIVEVEAYLGKDDPACHASRGMTPRNEVMFRSPGHCYVYLIYGMYHCVNVVSDPEGTGAAVLIRAVEPAEGLDVMARRRGISEERIRDLARGPGRLCEAFDITKPLSGGHFARSETIWLEDGPTVPDNRVGMSGRIGIRHGAELPLRFFDVDSRFVSS
jgi:DNA-3-methyladenine glycosylase